MWCVRCIFEEHLIFLEIIIVMDSFITFLSQGLCDKSCSHHCQVVSNLPINSSGEDFLVL